MNQHMVADAKSEKRIKSSERPRGRPVGSLGKSRFTAENKGIVNSPNDSENDMEFFCADVSTLKKAFAVFKAMMSKELIFVFDKDVVQIKGIDHRQKSKILVSFDCKKVFQYYCEKKNTVILQADNIHKIIAIMDKSYTMFKIHIKKRQPTSIIYFTLKNNMCIEESYEVTHVISNDSISDYSLYFSTEEYVMDFYMDCKSFKKLISTAKAFSDVIRIRKVKKENLVFMFDDEENTVKSRHTVTDPEKIKFKSVLCDDEIFSISVTIDYIKPVAYSMGLGITHIYLHESKNIIMESRLGDDMITIKVSTPTIVHQ